MNLDSIFLSVIEYEKSMNIWTVLLRVVLAALFGAIIGIERGRHGSQAGMRTHMFVCLGGALTSLLGAYSAQFLGFDTDPLRISAQVVSGIGFLGAGMIIVKSEKMITGLTTAAIMWTTAIIGIATGIGFYGGAVVAVLICAFTATVLSRIEHKRKQSASIYIEVDDLAEIESTIESVKKLLPTESHLEVISPKSATVGTLGIRIISSELSDETAFKSDVKSLSGVRFVIIE